jgi:hypothetical protein
MTGFAESSICQGFGHLSSCLSQPVLWVLLNDGLALSFLATDSVQVSGEEFHKG